MIFSLVLLFIIVENVETVYGIISYPSTSQRLDNIPTYCIISPSGITTTEKANLVNLATTGVSAWNDKLENYEKTNPLFWEMKSKVISSGDSVAGCDITINFKDEVDQLSGKEGFVTLGIFRFASQSIDIAFKDINLETIFNIMVHEIGHSIGLGHYVSDDNEENKKWYSGKIFSPSIMIPTMSDDPSKMDITDIDILKVRAIYGADGFSAFSPKPTPTPTPVPTPTPTPKPTPIIPITPIESIQISEDNIIVSKYDTKVVKISGQIEDSILHQGNPVYIIIKTPDLGFETYKIQPTKTGYFELPLVFDGNSKKGWYEVEASYLEHTDYRMNFDFYVGNSPISSTPLQPTTPELKSEPTTKTTSGKYLENISISSENNVYTVISYLSEKLDSMVLVKITAENECTKKKEVFQKDFMSNPGKKISLLFFQLDEGKPDECFIHFTISDFNGNVMEKITASYDVERQTQKQNSVKLLQSQKIPEWVKNNVKWWSDGQIDDDSFVQGIQYLVKEKIVTVPYSPNNSATSDNHVPGWIKNTAKWWSEGLIGDEDFLKGIQYLAQQGIIKVN